MSLSNLFKKNKNKEHESIPRSASVVGPLTYTENMQPQRVNNPAPSKATSSPPIDVATSDHMFVSDNILNQRRTLGSNQSVNNSINSLIEEGAVGSDWEPRTELRTTNSSFVPIQSGMQHLTNTPVSHNYTTVYTGAFPKTVTSTTTNRSMDYSASSTQYRPPSPTFLDLLEIRGKVNRALSMKASIDPNTAACL